MTAPASGFARFLILWAGQFVSLTGSSLSGFALGVHVYRLTGSATVLGFVFALAFLPMIVLSPVAGSLVDRWGSRRALLVSNVGGMLTTVVLAALLLSDTFAVWHLYAVVTVSSVLRALQIPAFEAALPLLVPKVHLGRANGLQMFALAASQVVAPAAAGALLLAIGIAGIVVMDGLSFAVAVLTLLVVAVPRARGTGRPATTGGVPLLDEFRQAWRYVAGRPGLLALLAFVGALNFSAGMVDVLITPLVLAFASPSELGAIMSVGGLGMLAAGLAMSVWGGPRRRIPGILGYSLLMGVATIVGAARPDLVLIGLAAVLFLGSLAIVIGCNQNIWQRKVPADLLGRALALQNMVATTPQLIGYALAGVLADHVFQPLVGHDQVRWPALAMLVGDGPGRGIALLLMVAGLLVVVAVVLGYRYPRLRHLEEDLPDVTYEAGDVTTAPAPARA